ncbi:hypothetical protein JHN52_01370 [Streptomyces sp. MBT97]|uniref:hypothetical protein n=1 Tax=Streptomyces sp. MBT97 TaxID=2800411 RepID=UPI00190DA3E6|nr:hypothetical protein [Streptomyces sp. MBT97]MBK3631631.1 hypothetical protein [Streptomyces sp. MBT97]
MSFLSGDMLTAGRLNRLQPVIAEGVATSALTMTTSTETDVPGASVTLVTATAGAGYRVSAAFDSNVLATNTTILMVGKLNVDGVTASSTAVHAMDTLDRDTVTMEWTGTLGAAGSHTFKLRGNLSGALATGGTFVQTNTKLVVEVFEVA